MNDHKKKVETFCKDCFEAWAVYSQYTKLFLSGEERHKLFEETALTFFSDLLKIYKGHLFLQICKLTDPAKTAGKFNLTTNYLIEYLPWPNNVKNKLISISSELDKFRAYIIPARHQILSHSGLTTYLEKKTLGTFPEGEEKVFWKNLQDFVNTAYGHFFGGIYPIESDSDGDANDLIVALKKAVDYDEYFKDKPSEKLRRRSQMKYADA